MKGREGKREKVREKRKREIEGEKDRVPWYPLDTLSCIQGYCYTRLEARVKEK
jgi:hypothetical protein